MATTANDGKIPVMATAMDGLLYVDDRGQVRIGGSRSRVINVVLDRRGGMTPEEIHEAYPHISMAQVHAALAYYHAHKDEMDANIEEEEREVEMMRSAAGESPFVKRMRAAGKLP